MWTRHGSPDTASTDSTLVAQAGLPCSVRLADNVTSRANVPRRTAGTVHVHVSAASLGNMPTHFDPAAMTWTCHICGDERPDPAVSVAKHLVEIGGDIQPGFTINVRYCNDREACTADATKPGARTIGAT